MKSKLTIFAISAAILFTGTASAQNFGKLGDKLKAAAGNAVKNAIPGNKPKESQAASQSQPSNGGLLQKAAGAVAKASVGTYYVSRETGSNRNDGKSASAPFKNLQKALDEAPAGAVILVAEGNYFGLLDAGNINISKAVTIRGGYSSDFSERDILAHRTLVQPTAESNGTQTGEGTMQIKVKDGSSVTIDGLLFDRGNSIAYTAETNPEKNGWPEGVETPMMEGNIGKQGLGGPDLSKTDVFSKYTSEVYLETPYCNLTISNCAFVNAINYAVRGNYRGTLTIDNCIFICTRMAAVEVRGTQNAPAEWSTLNFRNNTVLFSWDRGPSDIKARELGYAVRLLPQTHQNIENNILGLNQNCALDRTHVDTDANKDKMRKTAVVNNVFFLNTKGDLRIPGGGLMIDVKVEDLEDVETITTISGNKRLSDPAVFKRILDEAYLDGFLNAEYTETTSFNPNSPANTVRAAMGMNMVGTMSSKTTMYMNRYNFDKALLFFGAVEGVGAQLPNANVK